jgi:hypothetical protein
MSRRTARFVKRYFRGDTRELFKLAEDHGVALTDAPVPGE